MLESVNKDVEIAITNVLCFKKQKIIKASQIMKIQIKYN